MTENRVIKWSGGIIAGLVILLAAIYFMLKVENRELDQYARQNASGDFVQLTDGMVHYHLAGPSEKPLVVLIHGFSVPDYVWQPTLEGLTEAGFQVLSYDLYGRGYSDRPNLIYDIDLFQSQLEGLLKSLELDQPVHLVGLSMGGPIAARFAHQYPENVKSLVLIAPEVVQTTSSDIFPMNLPVLGEYLMTAIMEPIVLPKLQADDFFHPENFPEWEDRYRIQFQYRGTGKALLSTIRHLVSLDPVQEYKLVEKTGLPVMLIWGIEDQTISKSHIDILKEILPRLEVLELINAGHLPQLEYPNIVNTTLITFFSEYSD